MYGKGIQGLAGDLGLTEDGAQRIYDKFMETKPNVSQYVDDIHAFVKKHGYVETLQGYRRDLQDVFGGRTAEAGALRQSVNSVIQGTGAYLTLLAFVMVNEYITENGKETVVGTTVHDSILLDVPEDELEEMSQVVKIIMENLPVDFLNVEIEGQQMRYPIKADVEIGHNYNDLVGFDLEEYRTFNSYDGYIKYYRDTHEIIAHEDSGRITKEQSKQLVEAIEAQKESYKLI